jgi:hypothetical protein
MPCRGYAGTSYRVRLHSTPDPAASIDLRRTTWDQDGHDGYLTQEFGEARMTHRKPPGRSTAIGRLALPSFLAYPAARVKSGPEINPAVACYALTYSERLPARDTRSTQPCMPGRVGHSDIQVRLSVRKILRVSASALGHVWPRSPGRRSSTISGGGHPTA